MTALLALVACRSGPSAVLAPPPANTDLEVVPAQERIYGAWVVEGELPDGELDVELCGPEGPCRTWSTEAPIVVVALPETTRFDLVVRSAGVVVGEASFETGTLPESWTRPELEVLVHERDLTEPGHLLLQVGQDGPDQMLLVLDEALRPVWAVRNPRMWYSATVSDGKVYGVHAEDVVVQGLAGGREVRDHAPRLHHDVQVFDDGYWVLGDILADAWVPRSVDALDELVQTTIIEQVVIDAEPSGAERRRLALGDVLGTTRVGWTSFDYQEDVGGLNVFHSNALLRDPRDGDVIVSLRHQSAVVKASWDGEVDWLLADPAGWPEELRDRVLAPVGDVTWPDQQHAPDWHPETGELLLFDNGGYRDTPYGPPYDGDPRFSRVVAYEIDEGAGTVEETWSWQPPGAPLFSVIMGSADRMPGGSVLACWAWVRDDTVGSYADRGWGDRAAHIFEFRPDVAEPHLHLRVRSDREDVARGWFVYRAERIDPLWQYGARFVGPSTGQSGSPGPD